MAFDAYQTEHGLWRPVKVDDVLAYFCIRCVNLVLAEWVIKRQDVDALKTS